MKKFISIAAAFVAVVIITVGITDCDLTTEKKAEIKSALAQAGSLAYSTAGRAKLESFLSEQVSAGKLTESQKAEALAAADKGVEKLTAYLESASATSTAATSTTTSTSGTGTTSITVSTAATSGASNNVK